MDTSVSEPPPKIRLHVDSGLTAGGAVDIAPAQAHYLRNVMRQQPGDKIVVFNGGDGEWLAAIEQLGKGGGTLRAARQLRAPQREADIWLLFAPIKRARIDYLVEKATELGASTLLPVLTERTNVARVNLERLRATAIEAAEQCGRLSVPAVRPPQSLAALLDQWPGERALIWCSLADGAIAPGHALSALDGPLAVLIGPEGGLTPAEEEMLAAQARTVALRLGPRVLRAETAGLAALALVQAQAGDWRESGP